ncbi:MAG: tail fiber domain-containing protein [Verrucomicrobiota bacterium]
MKKTAKSKPCKGISGRRSLRSPGSGKRRGAGKPRQLPVDPHLILAKLSSLPIQTWNYKWDDPRTRHIGPMAQDFSKTFGVGDHRGISLTDALGVAYASIQALYELVSDRNAKIGALRRELQKLQVEIRRLRSR